MDPSGGFVVFRRSLDCRKGLFQEKGFTRLERDVGESLLAQRTARAVLCVCEESLSQLSAVNAATALNRIAKCPDGDAVFNDPRFIELEHIVDAAISNSKFDHRALSNTVWSYASLSLPNIPVMSAIATESMKFVREFSQQGLANSAWSYAKLQFTVQPLMDSISASALPTIIDFGVQNLAGIARPLADTLLRDCPLLTAISSATIPHVRTGGGDSQSISTISWAFSTLRYLDGPMLAATAYVAAERQVQPAQNRSGLLWAMWKGGDVEAMRAALQSWQIQHVSLDVGTLGVTLMNAEWECDTLGELCLQRAMLRDNALKQTYFLMKLVAGCFWPIDEVAPGSFLLSHQCSHRGGYGKLARMLELVEAELDTVRLDNAARVLHSVERFALHDSWLKVAGDDKALVIEQALNWRQFLSQGPVALEFGTFVGYTMVRLAWKAKQCDCPGGGVVSLELDPIHVSLARHIATLAGLSSYAEVWSGLTYDTQARLPEGFGHHSMNCTFMDHRGTKFHDDLFLLQRLRQQSVAAVYVADNVLKPGAPLLMWHVQQNRCNAAAAWSMQEFLHADAEDWMLVDLRPAPEGFLMRSRCLDY